MPQLFRGTALIRIATVLTLLAFAQSSAPACAESGKRAFDDVPVRTKSGARHPAYVAITYLTREIGLLTGETPKEFSGKKKLTRYELTVAVQALLTDMQHVVALADGPYVVPVPEIKLMRSPGHPAPKLPERRLEDPVCRKLQDPEILRATVAWLQALTGEFEDELAAVGADVAGVSLQLEQYRGRAKTISERLLSGLAFSDVPQGHPAYDWLMDLEDKILRFNLRETFWNRTYKGKRALTRYEFAYMTQRLAVDIRWVCRFDAGRDGPKVAEFDRTVTAINTPPAATSVGPPGVRLFRPGDAVFRNLANPEVLKESLQQLFSLYGLILDELKLLGVTDPQAEIEKIQQLQRDSGKIAARLRRLNLKAEAGR